MLAPQEIPRPADSLAPFVPYLDPGQRAELTHAVAQMRRRMAWRTWWNVSSTSRGGGVAEMLSSLVGYARGAGVDTRWLVIEGTPRFFRITKRLHHALHGSPGDLSPLGPEQRLVYDDVLAENAWALRELIQPDDVVLLHDPQTAGLARALTELGAIVFWRCHIGTELHNTQSALGWRFLDPDLRVVRASVFSSAAYIPDVCRLRSVVIPPSLDIFTAKNQPMSEETVRAILVHAGLIDAPANEAANQYSRRDGVRARVIRHAQVSRLGRAPGPEVPLVVQVSRWDPLKDPIGVIGGFCRLIRTAPWLRAELVLAGPSVEELRDDPEGEATLEAVTTVWRTLPDPERARIHLATLPMQDVEENAAIVNALQRHARVIVQKSLREGFGLTVTEALWKGRPVIATAVGGIREQLTDGKEGLLIQDARDLDAFAGAIRRVLEDPQLAAELGAAGQARVRRQFVATRTLTDYARLLEQVEEARPPLPTPPEPVVDVEAFLGMQP